MLFSTKSDFGSFFLAAVVSLAIDDDSPLGRTCRNFCFGLPTDSVHPKLAEQEDTRGGVIFVVTFANHPDPNVGDFLGMSLTTDNVRPSPKPNAWRVGDLTIARAFMGVSELVFCTAVLAVGKFHLGLELKRCKLCLFWSSCLEIKQVAAGALTRQPGNISASVGRGATSRELRASEKRESMRHSTQRHLHSEEQRGAIPDARRCDAGSHVYRTRVAIILRRSSRRAEHGNSVPNGHCAILRVRTFIIPRRPELCGSPHHPTRESVRRSSVKPFRQDRYATRRG